MSGADASRGTGRVPRAARRPKATADQAAADGIVAKPYHHGSLRESLVRSGLAKLSDPEGADLSLRDLAREVGVSAAAAYRHFPDKAALLGAIAIEGLEGLAACQLAAWRDSGGGDAGLAASGRAYVRFALDNPTLFRLIAAHAPRRERDAGIEDRSTAMSLLLGMAGQVAPPGVDVLAFARAKWAKAHGLAVLMLDGRIPADQATIDAVIGGA